MMGWQEKLQKIEALLAGTEFDGERKAAQFAKERLRKKFGEEPREYSVRSSSRWSKRLFLALCYKHGVSPYRYAKQRWTTTVVRVTKSFMDEILWPDFKKYDKMFSELADEMMGDLVDKIHRGESVEETIISGELTRAPTSP